MGAAACTLLRQCCDSGQVCIHLKWDRLQRCSVWHSHREQCRGIAQALTEVVPAEALQAVLHRAWGVECLPGLLAVLQVMPAGPAGLTCMPFLPGLRRAGAPANPLAIRP